MAWYGDRDVYRNTNPLASLRVSNPFVNGLSVGTKKTGKNHQYTAGDILINFTAGNRYTWRDKTNFAHDEMAAHSAYMAERITAPYQYPCCILLVRRNNFPNATEGWLEFIDYAKANGFFVQEYYSVVLVYYIDVIGGRTSDWNVRYLLSEDSRGLIGYRTIVPPQGAIDAGVSKIEYNQHYTSSKITTRLSTGAKMSGFLKNIVNGGLDFKEHGYYAFCTEQTKDEINSQYATLEEKIGETAYRDFMQRTVATFSPTWMPIPYEYTLGNRISASLPIFMQDQIEEMYNYLVNDEKGGVNQDDLVLSEIDLATNWKIYVHGERNPSIYITMNSPGVDAFLSDQEKNTGGYKKNDFKVEYLTPVFKIKYDKPLFEFDNIEEIQEPVETYDNMKISSWDSMTDVNYINKDVYVSGLWLGSPLNKYKLYAQNKFRLRLNENVFSTWCETGIGYIGSPMLEDFTKMNNWGSVLEGEITDGSTVEIIYNQLPPGIDDYDDPDDEIPSPDETAPGGYGLESVLTKTYKTDTIQMQELGKYLWGTSFIEDIKLVNNNPIENLVGCKRIPVSIPAGDFENIVMGNVTTTANGQIVNNIPIIDVGSVRYEGYYKNFLDYSPYTRLILFLPFCGFTELDPSVVTGKTLSVKYAIDVVLGKCRAMLFVDDAYYASFDGNFGVDIPITSSNRAQVDAGLVASGISALAQVGMAPATNVAKTAVSATMGGIESAVAAQYHSVRAGSYSSTCAWQETRTCFMIADIPTCQYPSSYAHDKGYPCQLTRSLSTMRGFTICNSDIDMRGFRCTEEEINMIREILATGIYL